MEFTEVNLQKLVLRANSHTDKDTILELRGTKAVKLEDMSNTDEEYDNRTSWSDLIGPARPRGISSIEVTTWSSLIRNALDIIKPQLEYVLGNIGSDEFKAVYKACLQKILIETDLKTNSNFPKRLFKEAEETDLIHSSVYLNNKNHLLKIFTDENGIDWYACAVYTGEIILVLEALLDTIYALLDYVTEDISKAWHHTLVLSYIDREELSDDNIVTEDIDEGHETINIKEFERDMISLGLQLKDTILAVHEITAKYNLKQAEDILAGIFIEDVPKEIQEARPEK